MYNPFPGPRPFKTEERKYFFGREHEKLELTARILANRVVFLYAQSGAGKTSLLNACLLPLLEKEEDFDVLPVVRLGKPLAKDVQAADVENIFVLNSLKAWTNVADTKSLLSQRLTHFLFDDFIKKSACLPDNETRPAPRVIVFDQFEEIFTTYPERWKDRKGFFLQLAAALDPDPEEWKDRLKLAGLPPNAIEPDRSLRVLFALREDHLANLHSYAELLPVKPVVRVRIERLRPSAACEAVENPAKLIDRPFEKGVACELVKKLLETRVKVAGGGVDTVEGEFVEPVQLQIICKKLFAISSASKPTIDSKDLLKLGDVNEPLAEYYNDAIRQAVELTGEKESALRDWFEHSLITPAGTRGTAFTDPDSPNAAGIRSSAITLFENLYLVRGENRPGGMWYELTHDRFIEPILQANKRWRDQYADENRQRIENKAAHWSRNEDEEGLLDEQELKAAENWLTTPEAAALGYSPTLLAYIKTSRAEVDRKSFVDKIRTTRRLRQFATAMAVLFVIAIGAAAYARYQSRKVEDINEKLYAVNTQLEEQSRSAKLGKEEAEKARNEAEAAKNEAIEEKDNAEDAREEAEDAIGRLEEANERAEQKAAEARRSAAEAQEARVQAEDAREDLEVAHEQLSRQAEALEVALGSAVESSRRSQEEKDRAERLSRTSQARELAAASRSEEDPFKSVQLSVEAIKNTSDDNLVVKEAVDSLRAVLPGALLAMPPLPDVRSVLAASFTANGSALITVSSDGRLRRWNLSSGKLETLDFRLDEQFGTSVLTRDAEILAVSTSAQPKDSSGKLSKPKTQDGLLRNILLINMETRQEAIILGHRRGVLRLTFDNQGEYLATSNTFGNYGVIKVNISGKSERIWNKPDFFEKLRVRVFHKPFRLANAFAFSYPGEKDDRVLLAIGFQNGEVLVRDAKSGDLYGRLPEPAAGGHTETILAMAFHPRDKYLVTSSRDDTVKIWSLSRESLEGSKRIATGYDLFSRQKYHDNPVTSIAFNPEGRLMATGSEDGTVWIWDVGPRFTAKPLVRLPDHTAQVMSVTFSADGKRLATVAADNQTRIWDISSLSEYLVLRDEVERIYRSSKSSPGDRSNASKLGITQLLHNLEKFLKRRNRNLPR